MALDAIEALLSLGLKEVDIQQFLNPTTSKTLQPGNWYAKNFKYGYFTYFC